MQRLFSLPFGFPCVAVKVMINGHSFRKIYTGVRSSVWDEPGQRLVVRVIIHLFMNTGEQTDNLSRLTIAIVRGDRRSPLDNS